MRSPLFICSVLAHLLLIKSPSIKAQQPSSVVDGSIQAYSVNWAAVSTKQQKDLTGTCLCDITESVCDINCCCDSDCSQDARNAFKDNQSCKYEGQKLGELDYCVAKSEVSKVNIPSSSGFYTITQKDAKQDFMSQLLCVVADSNPNLGAKYSDPVAKDSDVANLRTTCPTTKQASATSTSVYKIQGAIHTQYNLNTQVNKKMFTLPVAAFSSACEDIQRIGFMTPLPATSEEMFSSCSQPIQNLPRLQTFCASGAASAARFAGAAYASTPSDTSYNVPTQLVNLQVMDSSTGALTTLPLTSAPSPIYNATTGTCSYAVKQAIFTFIYNPSGSLQTSNPARLSLILANITLPAATDPSPVFQQRFRVAWVPASLADSPPEAFSGNPGYFVNYPVLAGLMVQSSTSSGTAVQRYFEGFPLPVAGPGGLCRPVQTMPLRFGVNSTSNCHLRMTPAQLANWCQAGAGNIAAALVGAVYPDLVASKVVVGAWGNSVHTDITQWIQVTATAPSVEPTWDATTLTCTNLPTGLNLRLITALTDAAATPKRKLMAAASCFRTGTWKFQGADGNVPQTFVVSHSVTFTALAQEPAKMSKKHVPPLVPNLPKDLLYPFLD